MNTKRWLALGIAVFLFIASISFQFITSLAFGNFAFEDNWFGTADKEISERVLEKGRANQKIVVLEVNGVIQDAVNPSSILETPAYSHKRFMKMLTYAGESNDVKGIVIRVNSPGGGVVESAEIYDRITEIQEKYEKPIYVSMGSMAASGGYYISTPADKIFASPDTLTGSLGVIMQSINYGELAEEYGVKFQTIKSGPYKDIMSPVRDMTSEERDILQTLINNAYEGFVDVISEGRGLSEGHVRQLADGRIYDGRQAKENGLIDEFGYLDETIEALKNDYNITGATVVKFDQDFALSSWFSMKVQDLLPKNREFSGVTEWLQQSNAPRLMYLYNN
jgi:protease IV